MASSESGAGFHGRVSLRAVVEAKVPLPEWHELLCFLAGVQNDPMRLLQALSGGEGADLRRLALAACAVGEIPKTRLERAVLAAARDRIGGTFWHEAWERIKGFDGTDMPACMAALEALWRAKARIGAGGLSLGKTLEAERRYEAKTILAALRPEVEERRGVPALPEGWEPRCEPNPGDGTLMALIPAGKFPAGDDRVPVEVREAYWLALHPVTNEQYAKFVREARFAAPDHSNFENPIWKDGSFLEEKKDHPVVGVSWADAVAYCEWAGLRLPTELEWEKGARGLDGRLYPWGDNPELWRCRCRWTRETEETCGVWEYREGRSPWGLYQMSGNAWEWCADEYHGDAYDRYCRRDLTYHEQALEEQSNHTYNNMCSRVLRGGSWISGLDDFFRAASRNYAPPAFRFATYGFRAARTYGLAPLQLYPIGGGSGGNTP